MRRIVMIAFVFPTMSVVCAYAQQCLYGPGETPARLTVADTAACERLNHHLSCAW
jgi:hypothetical protein